MQWYINHTIRYISPSLQSSDDKYDAPKEPLRLPSQPFPKHVGSSSHFVHHGHQYFGHAYMDHGQMFEYSHLQHGNPLDTLTQQVPTSYTLFPFHSTFVTGPSHMFATSSTTPPSAHNLGSSSMPSCRPDVSFMTLQTTVQHQDFSQSQHSDQDDEPQQQLQRRIRRLRRRPSCGTGGH